MNKDNPMSVEQAREFWRDLKALLGPRHAERIINDLANEMFSIHTRGKYAYRARSTHGDLMIQYIMELHKSGHLGARGSYVVGHTFPVGPGA